MIERQSSAVRVFTPSQPFRFVASVREIWTFRELLWQLARREVLVRYKQALLGAAWALLQPLSLMIVFTVFFSRFLKVPSDGIPYPLFAYCALLPWGFFAGSLSASVTSLTSNAHLVTKVYFPREILPLASILAASVDFGVATLLFVGMLVFYHVPVTVHLLFAPVIFLVQLVFTLGVGLFFSSLNVSYRDVRHAVPLLIQVWMFATPIIYPIGIIPERFRTLCLVMNPMAGIIDNYRTVVVRGLPPDPQILGLAALVSVVVAFSAYAYFKRAEVRFADII